MSLSSRSGLTVLITNASMRSRSGTVMYVRDLALKLHELGHRPIVFTSALGPVGDELIERTVPVVDDLDRLGLVPDLIHGHHHPQAMQAISHFPGVPAIFVCHDWMAWQDVPPQHPRILRHCAVDHTCRDKLVAMNGIPEAMTRVLYNAVDLRRFQPRAPLPPRPKRAVVFTNYQYDVTPVREACARLGIALDELGAASGRTVGAPEAVLGAYDLVFAKARTAIEAMAVGCAVVVCDFRGIAGLVRSDNFDGLRELNFGARSLKHPHETDRLCREIERYDPADAERVAAKIRDTAGLDALAADYLELYREVIEEYRRAPADAAAEGRAVARYIRDWGFTRRWQWEHEKLLRRMPRGLIRAAKRLLIGEPGRQP